MISLEQVRQLDIRVKKAVTALKSVSAENSALKAEIAGLKARLEELNTEVAGRKADEQELEVSLQGVLDVLDEVDGETSDVEPEPPADNYVVETVPLDEGPDTVEATEEDETEAAAVEEDEPEAAASEEEEPEDSTGSLFEEDAPEEVSEEAGTDAPEAEDSAAEPEAREAEQAPGTAESVSEEVPGVGQVVEFTSHDDATDRQAADGDEANEAALPPDAPEVEEVDLKQPPEDPVLTDDSGDDEFGSEFDIF